MDAATPATTAPAANPWAGYKMSDAELELFARSVRVSFGHEMGQSDAWRFGFSAGSVVHMAALLERLWDVSWTADLLASLAEARSLAACENTDQIAAWLISHGKAPAGDVAALRATGWAAGTGALCGYVYQLNYLLRTVTGQLD